MKSSLFWVVMHCMLVVVYRRFGIACRCHFKCRNAEKRCKRHYTEGGVGSDWFTGNEPVRVEHGGKEDKRSGRLQDNTGKMWKGPEKFRRKKDGVGGAYKEHWRKESRLGTGYHVSVCDTTTKTWGNGTEPPKGRCHIYSGGGGGMKTGTGKEDFSKQMVKTEAQRMWGSTAIWAGRRGKKKGQMSGLRGSGRDRERQALEPKPEGATVESE